MNQNKVNLAILFGIFFTVMGINNKDFWTLLAGAAFITLIFTPD